MTDEDMRQAHELLDLDGERRDFICGFVINVVVGLEGSWTRQYLDAIVNDAQYVWDKIEAGAWLRNPKTK